MEETRKTRCYLPELVQKACLLLAAYQRHRRVPPALWSSTLIVPFVRVKLRIGLQVKLHNRTKPTNRCPGQRCATTFILLEGTKFPSVFRHEGENLVPPFSEIG